MKTSAIPGGWMSTFLFPFPPTVLPLCLNFAGSEDLEGGWAGRSDLVYTLKRRIGSKLEYEKHEGSFKRYRSRNRSCYT